VKLNDCHASSYSLEHVSIYTRCKDVDVDAYVANIAMNVSLNDHITKLEEQAKIGKVELENEKIIYARGVYLSGRHPRIKDGVGFQRGSKENAKIKVNDHEFHKFAKEKGKNLLFIMFIPLMVMLMLRMLMLVLHMLILCILHLLKHPMLGIMFLMSNLLVPSANTKNTSNGPFMSYHTFDASYAVTNKFGKVVAKYVNLGTRTPNIVFGCQRRLLLT
jgi:hypothetical protein